MGRWPAVALLVLLAPAAARGQQRPALTEDPRPIAAGHVLADAGIEFGHDVFFPASGLRGDLWTLGVFGVRVGLGAIVELRITGTAWKTLAIASRQPAPLGPAVEAAGDRTGGAGDAAVATKVRILAETATRPALGVRFTTKLPTEGDASGLGLDTTDFYADLLVGKTLHATRIAANLGVGILADPVRGDRQNDVLTYAASLTRALGSRLDLVADIQGRVSVRSAADTPPGTGTQGTARAGIRRAVGKGWLDAALVIGLGRPDPDLGFAAGYSVLVPAFRVP